MLIWSAIAPYTNDRSWHSRIRQFSHHHDIFWSLIRILCRLFTNLKTQWSLEYFWAIIYALNAYLVHFHFQTKPLIFIYVENLEPKIIMYIIIIMFLSISNFYFLSMKFCMQIYAKDLCYD